MRRVRYSKKIRELGFQILDCGFLVRGIFIPDSWSWILDSKAQESGYLIHGASSLCWGVPAFERDTESIFLLILLGDEELWGEVRELSDWISSVIILIAVNDRNTTEWISPWRPFWEQKKVTVAVREESKYGLSAKKVAVLERFKQGRQVLCCICLPPASYVSATISLPATLE